MKYNKTNDILFNHGDWLEVDVSTNKHPDAVMLIDTQDWDMIQSIPTYGRVSAFTPGVNHYTYARLMERQDEGRAIQRLIHKLVLPDCKIINHIALVGMTTGLDNRRVNLEESNPKHNAGHRHVSSRNTTGVRGVCVLHGESHKNSPYQASIIVGGSRFTKCFATLDGASLWRKEHEVELLGSMAVNNKREE